MTAKEKVSEVKKVLANYKFSDRELVDIMNHILKAEDRAEVRVPKYSISEIEAQVEGYTGITLMQMNTLKRNREVVEARQFAHYKARQFTVQTLDYIGAYFGHKDHTTALHSIRTITDYLEVDRSFREKHEEFLNN